MLTLGSHQDPSQRRLVIQLLDFVQPPEAVLEAVLIGAVVDQHDEIGVLAQAEGDGLVELVSAEVEEEEFDGELLFGEGD